MYRLPMLVLASIGPVIEIAVVIVSLVLIAVLIRSARRPHLDCLDRELIGVGAMATRL